MHHMKLPGSDFLASLLMVFLLLLSGCVQADSSLTIAAAASLRGAFEELAPIYQRRSGQSLRYSFAASGLLQSQIRQGAPFDAFASASLEEMTRVKDLLRGEPSVFASNRLVLVSAKTGAPCDWPTVRTHKLAIGNPATVPAGVYAREALSHAKQWPFPAAGLILTENARQSVDYLRQGVADYGIVYQSDQKVFGLSGCHSFTASAHRPIRLAGAVIAASAPERRAENWLAFLLGAEAQAVLARHGFGPP